MQSTVWQTVITTLISALVAAVTADVIAHIKAQSKKHKERIAVDQEIVTKKIVAEENKNIEKAISTCNQKLDSMRAEDLSPLKKASRDSLRYNLYEIYDKCEERGWRTKDEISSESEMFDSYKALKGNHGCDSRHANFEKLPIRKESEN